VSVRDGVQRRGTTNRNARGGAEDRRRRREWLVATWRADVDVVLMAGPIVEGWVEVPLGQGLPACRCYRCGRLLTVETVSADRTVPGCQGGTYRRSNIRPACARCQSVVGGATRSNGKGAAVPGINARRNSRRRGARNGAAVSAPAVPDRKAAPCEKCGAQPGHSCVTLTSKRQVEAGREGAYLKPMANPHAGRGRAR
jgi:hypothetical protein